MRFLITFITIAEENLCGAGGKFRTVNENYYLAYVNCDAKAPRIFRMLAAVEGAFIYVKPELRS